MAPLKKDSFFIINIRVVGAAYNGAVSIDYQRNTTGCLPFSPTAPDPRIWCLNGDGIKWVHYQEGQLSRRLTLVLRRPCSATTRTNGDGSIYRNDSVDKTKLIINESILR
jgi:hypothetical protein